MLTPWRRITDPGDPGHTGRTFSEKGFTLLELVIAAALSAVLFGSLAKALSVGIGSYNRQEIRAELYQIGSVALDRITRELRAGGVPSIAPAAITFPVDSDDDDVFDATLRFSHSGDQILRQLDSEAPQVLAEKVSSLTFEGEDVSTIRIVLKEENEIVELRTAVRHAN